MFDVVRNNKRIVQLFLALITLPFAFWGVESYMRSAGDSEEIAAVGGDKITRQQFVRAARDQQERVRGMLGANYNPAMFDTPEARLAILNSLVDQRIVQLEAARGHLMASDELLREIIARIPALQENGQFSMARYEAALRAQGMTQAGFEAQMRQDLTLQQLVSAVSETTFVANSSTDALAKILAEERQVAEIRYQPAQFAGQVKIADADLKSFYDANQKRFEIPEQLRAEYAVLSLDALLSQVTVSAEEVKAAYESHKDRYQQAEERRASHILIKAEAKASDADKAKAKAKAESILAQLKKAPGDFEKLAKQNSDDPGSADKGGDLGFFGRGAMVKPFDDAAFGLKEGQLSGIVQSDFGYHIIKVTGVKEAKGKSFDEVRGEIETELKRQAASRKYAEAAESFSNTVYEQSDSLKPVAEKFKLQIQQSGWIPRTLNPALAAQLGLLGNEKLRASLFSDDALKNKRNSEAVEVAPNTLVAARVLEHKPAAIKPFDQVKGDIEAAMRNERATALAKQAGEQGLADLQKGGEDKVNWSPLRTVSRFDGRQVPPPVLAAIFKASVKKLPAYAGVDLQGGGYAIYKIVQVGQPEKNDENRRKLVQREFSQVAAQQDFAAYLAGLRGRYKVEINKAALEASRDR